MLRLGVLLLLLGSRLAVADEVIAISAGDHHSCALLKSGQVMCWGSWPRHRRAGLLPVRIEGVSDATALSSGASHSCVIEKAGGVRCWGWNNFGQLGDGTTRDSAPALLVSGIPAAASLFAGHRATCTIAKDGSVHCVGEGDHSEPKALYTPAAISGRNVIAVSSPNAQRMVALIKDQKDDVLLAWGEELSRGKLPSPRRIDGISAVSALGGGPCALLRSGEVACWGLRHGGQRGDGRVDPDLSIRAEVFSATRVKGLRDAAALSDGGLFSCALRKSGQVVCWGENRDGQLGIGSRAPSPQPATVVGIDDATAITAGGRHACALRRSGQVFCWGDNMLGQLGDGTTAARAHPVAVLGLPGSPAMVDDPVRAVETARHAYDFLLSALRVHKDQRLLTFVRECAANEICQTVCADALSHMLDRPRAVADIRACLPVLSQRVAPQLAEAKRADLAQLIEQLPIALTTAQ